MIKGRDEKAVDQLLFTRIQRGDVTAFDSFYEKYWEKVYSAAYKRLQDVGQAKDVTQDVFLQLWIKRNEIAIDNPAGYLFTATFNKVYNVMEKEKKYVPIPDLLAELWSNNDKADADLLYHEFLVAYEELVQSLTTSQQQIFRMRFHDDLSTAEIAEKLAISRKTVQNQLGKAIAQLRSSLALIALLLSQR